MALLNFNASLVEPARDYEPIPAGQYEAVATESEMLPTKSGTGSYLKITFEIVSGEYKGRKLWARLNLANPSKTAVEIAQKELSAICRAVGVLVPKDSSELHNIPLMVRVAVVEGAQGPANDIRGYSPRGGAAQAAQAAQTVPQQAVPATGKAPW